MFRNRKILSMFLSLVLVLGVVLGFAPQDVFAAETDTLTILHVNDVHGRVEYAAEGEASIGFAKLKTKVDELKAANPKVVLLNAGDTLHGTVDINLSKGKSMIELMNMVGFDAMVPGNHDFNYGYARLLELKAMADFPIVAANIVKEKDGSTDFDGYTIKEVDGLKVGIFGIATEETKVKSHPDNTIGIGFTDYMKAAKDMVAKLKAENVDAIVALVHVGIDGETNITTEDIAKGVEGIDVIVDGHSHTELPNGKMVGNTLMVQAGSYLKNIGMVELKFEGGNITNKSASLFTVGQAAGLAEDAGVKSYIEKMLEENEVAKAVVIGKSKVELVGKKEVVRAGESNLGNVITDAMRKAAAADVALTNGGGIRASIPAGDITAGGAMTAFPFTNFLSTIEVTGSDIIAALEHGVAEYPNVAGKFPHVSGMKYVFDPERPAGNKVFEVTIGDKALVKDAKYTLVTNDFMATGGDGYDMFKGKKIIAEGALLSDVLIDYLKAEGEINPTIEGRITTGKAPALAAVATRLFGPGRVQTAINVSKQAYKDGQGKTVVLAGYDGQVDASTGTLLAKNQKAPLLITNKKDIGEIKAELTRLGAEKVYILGGEKVVYPEVEKQLKAMNLTVKRLGGKSRVETAVKIAEEVFGESKPSQGFVVDYDGLVDALAIGPVSAMKNAPIFITHKDKLAGETKAALEKFGLKDLTIVGGEKVVSEKGKKALEAVTGKAVERVSGVNRIRTSLEIAEKYFPNPKALVIASGYAPYADALTSGYFADKMNGPIILSNVNTIDNEVLLYVGDKSVDTYVLGGEKVISEKVLTKIKDTLKGEKKEGKIQDLQPVTQ